MSKSLLVIESDDQGHFFLAIDGSTVAVGDRPNHPEVLLRGLHISRIHCEFDVEDDLIAFSDPASGGNGHDVIKNLLVGDHVTIGHARLSLAPGESSPVAVSADSLLSASSPEPIPGAAPPGPQAAAAVPIIPPLDEPAAAAMPLRFVVTDGADKGRIFNLPGAGSTNIGNSNKHAEIVLHDLYVARVHADVEVQGARVFVVPARAEAATLVNNQPITQRHELKLGDILRVGNSHLRLEICVPQPAAEEEPIEAELELIDDDAVDGADPEIVSAEEALIPEEETLEPEGERRSSVPPGEPTRSPHAAVNRLLSLENQPLGHYQLGELLGCGITGLVFRATDTKNQHVLALKVLSPDFPAEAPELHRFVITLKTAAPLHHPNLVTILGAGKTGHHCWIAREYVEGENCAVRVRRLVNEDKLAWKPALRIAVHLARALSFLHKHKVLHGNLTPRNVLVNGQQKVTKLADACYLKALEGSKLSRDILEDKFLVDLPYLPPEQTEPDVPVDPVAELYSVGAIVYEQLMGRPPFLGATPEETIRLINQAKLPRPSKFQQTMPLAFETVLLKLLAKNPEDRHQTASQLLRELEPLAHEHQVVT